MATELLTLTWEMMEEVTEFMAKACADVLSVRPVMDIRIFGEPRGGLPLAVALSHRIGVDLYIGPTSGLCPDCRVIWIDDVLDSGFSYTAAQERFGARFTCGVVWVNKQPRKYCVPALTEVSLDTWVVFPWENRKAALGDRDAYLEKRGQK